MEVTLDVSHELISSLKRKLLSLTNNESMFVTALVFHAEMFLYVAVTESRSSYKYSLTATWIVLSFKLIKASPKILQSSSIRSNEKQTDKTG